MGYCQLRADFVHGTFIGGYNRTFFIERPSKFACLRVITKLKKLSHLKLINIEDVTKIAIKQKGVQL